MNKQKLPTPSSDTQVADFLRQVAKAPVVHQGQGRLIFAMDATGSRQPSWDRACQLQGQMFTETAALGGLNIQLVWYRGFAEFEASPWFSQAQQMLTHMNQVFCAGGTTQIGRVLQHTLTETRQHRINALVFVGDCMEEDPKILYKLAGELGLLGVPIFLFQEGAEPTAAATFRHLAQLSHGAYCAFDAGSARQLRELLAAVAVYAAGGRRALEDLGQRKGGLAQRLTHQMQRR